MGKSTISAGRPVIDPVRRCMQSAWEIYRAAPFYSPGLGPAGVPFVRRARVRAVASGPPLLQARSSVRGAAGEAATVEGFHHGKLLALSREGRPGAWKARVVRRVA